MIRSLSFFSLLFALGCASTPSELPAGKGFSFTIPDNWNISEQQEYMEGSGYYLSIEKSGEEESGLFSMTWINDTIAHEEMLEDYFQGIRDSELIEPGDLFLETPREVSFNGIPARSITYNAMVLGLEHQGEALSFLCNDRVYLVVFQEAIEDAEDNRPGFETIRNSFACEEVDSSEQ